MPPRGLKISLGGTKIAKNRVKIVKNHPKTAKLSSEVRWVNVSIVIWSMLGQLLGIIFDKKK